MQTDTTTEAPGCAIVATTLGEARERLRAYLDTREFWVILFDASGLPLVEEISQRHYQDRTAEDCYYALIPAPSGAGMIGVAVFRRSLMLAPKLRFILTKHQINMSAQEIARGQAICSAWLQNRCHVLALGRELGLKEGDDLGDGIITCHHLSSK